ncbi:hypothetical protein P9112_011608 [Eukaryota sp. TZLM1-RC]
MVTSENVCPEYLRRFLQVKNRASGLKLPDTAFLNRFARGILPVGLERSHSNDAPENLTNPISSVYLASTVFVLRKMGKSSVVVELKLN